MSEYLRYLVTLTAVLDPFLAIPIFLSVTAGRDRAAQKRLADAVTLTVLVVLTGSVFLGEAVLKVMGASLQAFQVGGGLVLLLMALAMLNAEAGSMRQTKAEALEIQEGEVSGVVPLAVPLLAGPGAIGTSIIAGETGGVPHKLALTGCVVLVCLLLWLVLRGAHAVGERISKTGLNVATRLLGLLLAAIAIETMAEGLKRLFPGLAT
jgi:multiple antibiotic resistance protein